MNKDVRQLIRRLRKQDFVVRPTDNGHFKVSRPDGDFVIMPSSPSDWRSMKNATVRLRKIGYRDR